MENQLLLKDLCPEDADAQYDFFQSMPEENGFLNPYLGMDKSTFIQYAIPQRLLYSGGQALPPGHVPDTYCFLWWGDTIVGIFKLRHYLNDTLKNGSGHIGYGILPNWRGRGFATAGLKLAIHRLCRMPDFDGGEIHLATLKDNPASLRVMLKNGGYVHHEDETTLYVRIPSEAD